MNSNCRKFRPLSGRSETCFEVTVWPMLEFSDSTAISRARSPSTCSDTAPTSSVRIDAKDLVHFQLVRGQDGELEAVLLSVTRYVPTGRSGK